MVDYYLHTDKFGRPVKNPPHEGHMRLTGDKNAFPDLDKFLVTVGPNKQEVHFSPGMSFIQYRMALFSLRNKIFNFAMPTDLDLEENKWYTLSSGERMKRVGQKVFVSDHGNGLIEKPYSEVRRLARGLTGYNRISNAGNKLISNQGKKTGASTVFRTKYPGG